MKKQPKKVVKKEAKFQIKNLTRSQLRLIRLMLYSKLESFNKLIDDLQNGKKRITASQFDHMMDTREDLKSILKQF